MSSFLRIASERLIGVETREGFQDRLGHFRHGTDFPMFHDLFEDWSSSRDEPGRILEVWAFLVLF